MMKILIPLGCTILFYSESMSALTIGCVSFFLCVPLLPMLISPFCSNSVLFLDGLSCIMILLTLWVGGLMYISSGGLKIKGFKEFYLIVSSLCFILVIVFSSSSLFVFYVFFEFSLIPITVMVLGWGYQPERLQASNYLVLYTVGASLPLLVSVCVIFYWNGHCSFYLSGWGVPGVFNSGVWWGLTILAFLAKTPLYFLHLWLPKAHVEAPVAGSMVLAAILLKLGGYGLLRLLINYQSISVQLSGVLSSVAIWGGVICSLICLRQTDIKALIAYSSITHMGIMVGGFMSNSVWGWQGGLMMMLSHGLVSSSMFLGAYMMYKVYGTRSLYLIKGAMSVMPFMALVWFFSASANMGVPPTINLQSEIMLVTSIVEISKGYIIPLSMSLFFSAAYSLFLYSSTQNGHLSSSLHFFYYLSLSDLVSMFMHLVPAFIILVKSDLLLSWLL